MATRWFLKKISIRVHYCNNNFTHPCDFARRAAELGIEFHQDVGNVLPLAPLDVSILHTLRNHSVTAITRLLDPFIAYGILPSQQEDHHLRLSASSFSHDLVEKVSNAFGLIRRSFHDRRIRIGNFAAMAFVGVDEST